MPRRYVYIRLAFFCSEPYQSAGEEIYLVSYVVMNIIYCGLVSSFVFKQFVVLYKNCVLRVLLTFPEYLY